MYGPSGREQAASDVIKAYVEPYCDEVYNDVLGNLIAVKKGTSGKKIMFSAHIVITSYSIHYTKLYDCKISIACFAQMSIVKIKYVLIFSLLRKLC